MKQFSFLLIVLVGLCSISYAQTGEPVILGDGGENTSPYIDPAQGGPQRSPIYVPSVFLSDHTLIFERCCIGSEIEISQNDEVLYSTTITDENGIVFLPENLSGCFELHLYWGSLVFFGEIDLE